MQLFKGGIRVGRIFGVAIFIDYSWFVFFGLVVWTFGRFYFPEHGGYTAPVSWALAVSASLLLFASVLAHELSHAAVSNRLGFPIRKITLFIFGGVAHMHSEPEDAKTEFLVAVAGPLSSVALWLGFLGAGAFLEIAGMQEMLAVAALVAQLNLVLALFNLVPGFPLDGGRLLRAAVWWKSGDIRLATSVAAKGGAIFSYVLMFLGVVMIFTTNWINGIWYILIGIFLRGAAEASYHHVLVEEVLEGIAVREIMGVNPMSVTEDDSIDSLESIFMRRKFTEYPVVDSSGAVVGLIDVGDVRNVPAEERGTKTVGDVMHRVPRPRLPRPGSTAMDALRAMIALGIARLPVVDDDGHVAGIISRGDIMRTFEIREELGREVVV